MYPRNAASPEPVAIGPVIQIADGAVQTSGVTVRIKPKGVAEADGGGTTSYSTDGIVYYTPTQAETDYTSFILIAKKTGCIPASVTVVTSASATAGKVVLSGETHTGAVIPTVSTVTDGAKSATALSTANWTNTLATNLGISNATIAANLDVAVSVIQSQISALNNLSAKANWFGSLLLEVPDSGTRAYIYELVIKDDEDKLINLDGLPTIALTNAAGTDRSSLITTTIANPATGRYTLTITVGTSTVNESLKLTATGTISGETRYAVIAPQVVDYDNATQVALILTRMGVPAVSIADDIASEAVKTSAIKTQTDQLGFTVPGKVDAHAELDSAALALINKIEASTAGTVSGAGTDTEVFVGSNVTLTITVDADGNRSAVVVS